MYIDRHEWGRGESESADCYLRHSGNGCKKNLPFAPTRRARMEGRQAPFCTHISVAVVKCIEAEVDFERQTSSPLIERGYKIRPRESSCIHHLGVKFILSASGLQRLTVSGCTEDESCS